MTADGPEGAVHGELRARLAALADALVPGVGGMPAPSSVDIGGSLLDAVVRSRPDLLPHLRRALEAPPDEGDPVGWLEGLRAADPEAGDALATAIVAGYYLHPEVRRLLGYPGQTPRQVSVDALPAYVEEGLLERVYARGPIYRRTPPDASA